MENFNNSIGYWAKDSEGLPCFYYTGNLPYEEHLDNGVKVKLPEDPWFLLGNYQLTLFTHISGEYELITGQRSWGRMNNGKKRNSGNNTATAIINGNKFNLIGANSLATTSKTCEKIFGCGFAIYNYKIDNINIQRKISVKPSTNPYNGVPAFLLEIKIENRSSSAKTISYLESVASNYDEIQYHNLDKSNRKVNYKNTAFSNNDMNAVGFNITAETPDPLLFSDKESMSIYEGFPPCLFAAKIHGEYLLSTEQNSINANWNLEI